MHNSAFFLIQCHSPQDVLREIVQNVEIRFEVKAGYVTDIQLSIYWQLSQT